jgi:hypothetical protein
LNSSGWNNQEFERGKIKNRRKIKFSSYCPHSVNFEVSPPGSLYRSFFSFILSNISALLRYLKFSGIFTPEGRKIFGKNIKKC